MRKPMFQPPDAKISLRLVDISAFGNGVVLLRCQRPDAQDRGIRDAAAFEYLVIW